MNFVAFDPQIHGLYVNQVLPGCPYDMHTKGIIAVLHGACVGVVLLKNWTPNSCEGHIAVQNKMALRSIHKEAFKYVFEVCGRKMLLGLTPDDDTNNVDFFRHLGFTELCRIKDGFADGVDQMVFQMLKEDCKHLTKLKQQEAA